MRGFEILFRATRLGRALCVCCGVAAFHSGCGGKADSAPGASLTASAVDARQALPATNSRDAPGAYELCLQNPLISPCPTAPPSPPPASTTAPPPRQTPAPAPVPERPSDNPLLSEVQRVEAILEENCGSCHGREARSACGPLCDGMTYIDDVKRLIDEQKILPCRWQDSRVAKRIRDGSMPPPQVPPARVSAGDEAQVGDFVDGLCANLTGGGSFDVERLAAENLLDQHCGACHGQLPPDAGPPPGGLAGVDDIAGLIAEEFLVPCASSSSPIVSALREGRMPPAGSQGSRPSPFEIDALAAFIDRPCRR